MWPWGRIQNGCADWTTLRPPDFRYYRRRLGSALATLSNAHESLLRATGNSRTKLHRFSGGIRATGAMEYLRARSGSLRLDVSRPDHLGPLLGFVGDELPEIGRRADKDCFPHVGEAHLDLGIGEARVDLLVELLDDFHRRVLGGADAVPRARLIARNELANGWDVRQRFRAPLSGDRERPQLPGPYVLDRRWHGGEHHLHLCAHQVG